ncbi:urea ABC transporter permease, partial [bacterium]|nr:urea ABC transporter permease [bacterium]
MQLELLKPEIYLAEQSVHSTIVVFGGTQIVPRDRAEAALREARAAAKKSPDDPLLPSLIFGFGDWVAEFDGRSVAFYHLVLAIVVAVYLALRCLVNSTFGFLLVGVREEPERTETFGYDVRLIQLSVFCLAAA